MKCAVSRLADAIDYPETVPDEAMAFDFEVDGEKVSAREVHGRLILERTLWTGNPDEATDFDRIPRELAVFAAGRILREEAVLAWDPQSFRAFLWQDVSSSLPDVKFRRFFEVFMASCDWWSDRVADLTKEAPVFPEMFIRP